MANPEHLEILKQGVEVWNAWRRKRREVLPRPDLSFANFSGADLSFTDLLSANLISADLSGASLSFVNLSDATLIDANLSGADLFNANLSYARLRGADFTGARLAFTIFAANNLSNVKGLETVTHDSPSSIGVDTLYRSAGKIPEVFLRGCGIPEPFIVQIPALIAAMKPIQFYSCFISYSSKDQSFAERFHADLQSIGVRVWFAPHHMKIGAHIRPTIDDSIRVYDKLLLVLSKSSVNSQWVEQEVETALERERKEKRTVLFPIRLDDAVMRVEGGWPALIRNTRNIGDFRQWKNHDSYQKAFDRLLRDLKAEG